MGTLTVVRTGVPAGAWNPGTPSYGAYAATDGSAGGAGTIGDPWTLAKAFSLTGGEVSGITPGPDNTRTVWVREGTYAADVIQLSTVGTATNPVQFRPFPNEWPVLQAPNVTANDSTKHIVQYTTGSAYTWLRGLILHRLQSDRTIRSGDGVRILGASNRVINLVIYDNADNGIAAQQSHSGGVWIYGCLVLNCGWDESDRGHGHGLYLQNDGSVQMQVGANIFPPGFGHGIQIYGSGAVLDNFLLNAYNIGWHNGRIANLNPQWEKVLVAYRDNVAGIHNLTVQNLLAYTGSAGRNINVAVLIGQTAYDNTNIIVEDGYIVGRFVLNNDENGASVQRNTLISGNDTLYSLPTQGNVSPASLGYVSEDNAFYSTNGSPFSAPNGGAPSSYNLANWRSTFGFDLNSTLVNGVPSVTISFLQINPYLDDHDAELGKLHIYNWGGLSEFEVDVTSVLDSGQQYRLMNNQRPADRTADYTGTVSAGAITVPIEEVTPQEPSGTGWRAAETTGTEFASFTLYRA